MIRHHLACISTLIVGILSKGLVVEEVGDFDQHSHPMGPFEISRYPHYDTIRENIQQQEGSIDYNLYISQLPGEDEGSEHLTDLPDELQQLQQQLLEASRVEVHSHEIEIDPSTGWPWYMATIPPGDFYDCLFLYFSCTDYEEPDWPGNKEKCTNLFDYCITYTEKNANITDSKDPFVTKIPISSEIITSSLRPSQAASASTESSSTESSTPKPSSTTEKAELSSEAQGLTSGEQAPSSEKPSEISSETPASSETSNETQTSSETPIEIPEQSETESEKPAPFETSSESNTSSEKPSTSDTSSETSSSSEVSSETPSLSEVTSEISSSSEDSSEAPPSSQVSSETPTSLETTSETQASTETSSVAPSDTSSLSSSNEIASEASSETPVSSTLAQSESSPGSSSSPEEPSSESSSESSSLPAEATSESSSESSSSPKEPSSENISETPASSGTSSEEQIPSESSETSESSESDISSEAPASPESSSQVQTSSESSPETSSPTSSETSETASETSVSTGPSNSFETTPEEPSSSDTSSEASTSSKPSVSSEASGISQTPESSSSTETSSIQPTTPTTSSGTSSPSSDQSSSTADSTTEVTSDSSSSADSSTTSSENLSTVSTSTSTATPSSLTEAPTPSTSSSTNPSTTPSTTTNTLPSTEKPSTVKAEIQNAAISGLPLPPDPSGRPKKKPASCSDLYTLKGIRESGTYPILVAGENITVYCDMETRGGGWTVLQRRGDFGTPEDYFLRKWPAYKNGFGNPEEDHWVGLRFWNNITLSTPQQLLIEMEDWFGNKTEIVVNNFIIGTEFYKFRIIYASVDGEFGESLPKKGTKFSTLDNDNDAWRNNCASRFKGAWWYSACHNSNLNGLYLKGEHESFGNGVNWYHWTGYHYSLKRTEMKVRVQSKGVTLGFLKAGTEKQRRIS